MSSADDARRASALKKIEAMEATFAKLLDEVEAIAPLDISEEPFGCLDFAHAKRSMKEAVVWARQGINAHLAA